MPDTNTTFSPDETELDNFITAHELYKLIWGSRNSSIFINCSTLISHTPNPSKNPPDDSHESQPNPTSHYFEVKKNAASLTIWYLNNPQTILNYYLSPNGDIYIG